MLALQLATIAVIVTMAVSAAYTSAGHEASQTKITMLKAMNKRFIEDSTRNLLSQVLKNSGGSTCSEKKKFAALALAELEVLLGAKDAKLSVGFTRDLKNCNCHSPSHLVLASGIQTTAAEAIFSCVEGELAIQKASESGFAVVLIELEKTSEKITLAYGDLNENSSGGFLNAG